MRSYSSFTQKYVQDICDALNEIGDVAMINDLTKKPFKPEYFETLTQFLQNYIVNSLDRFTFLNDRGLVNRGKCPYTGEQIDSTFPSWSFMGNRRVYVSHEGYAIMKREDDEEYEKLYGHPRPAKPQKKQSGCYIATACYGSEYAPEVLLLKNYRDKVLSTILIGRLFISFYYYVSPWIAKKLQKREYVNKVVRIIIVDKIVRRIKNKRKDLDQTINAT